MGYTKLILMAATALSVAFSSPSHAQGRSSASNTELQFTLRDLDTTDSYLPVAPEFSNTQGQFYSIVSSQIGGEYREKDGPIPVGTAMGGDDELDRVSYSWTTDGNFGASTEARRSGGTGYAITRVQFSVLVLVMPYTSIEFSTHALVSSEFLETSFFIANSSAVFLSLGNDDFGDLDSASITTPGTVEKDLFVSHVNNSNQAEQMRLNLWTFSVASSLVPEPSTWLAFIAGLVVLTFRMRGKCLAAWRNAICADGPPILRTS
ncbi:PEP-CTERM sorting domain-containing protein [Pseudoduganella umbonata]|nr:PEP-CTERM sorting domain-containing protein [Pseudoduganella umbonata]MBB3221302.1 hypothetical protein [Pseudoduganella umbonata]